MSLTWNRTFGWSAALLALAVSGEANAQANRGSQIEQRIMNEVGNALIQQGGGQYGARGPNGSPNNAYSPYNRGPNYNNPYGSRYGQPGYGPNGYSRNDFGNMGYGPTRQQQSFYGPTRRDAVVQRYQMPGQYAGYPAGSVINYGGTSYVVNQDGTMSPSTGGNAASATATAQRYQIPSQYAGTAPGQVINYGGVNYLINNDGTMSPY